MPELPVGTITLLLTDVEGSTARWEHDPEAMRRLIAEQEALVSAGVSAHGGMVVKSRGEGDSVFAVFNRASDAVAAAQQVQMGLRDQELKVRMALHTGEAQLREGDYYGGTVNRCARLRAVAHGGQVLLSDATRAMVTDELPAGATLIDLGEHRLRDLTRPEHVHQLAHPQLPRDFPPLRSVERYATNLPLQLTSFVGRERELAEVRRMLGETRLLTLTGAGGCGKTRLALHAAAELLEDFADGVWLVELAPLADPALVPATVAAALGLREQPGQSAEQSLLAALRARSLLILIDNCEHLVEACAELAESLLTACPGVRLLLTSREALNIAGEASWTVPSLALAEAGGDGDADAPEAVRLFVERARATHPAFQLSERNRSAVVQICQRLDGLPLAIELAATRVRVMSVDEILSRLQDRFRLLTGGRRTAMARQQTLLAAVGWSHDLLGEDERVLFRRLSVFAGGFTVEAAEAVCAGDGLEPHQVLDLLARLVDKSLVAVEEAPGGPRHRLLETLRQYARERLMEAGEAESYHRRHASHFLATVEAAERRLRALDSMTAMGGLTAEHDNLRAALEWSSVDGPSTAIRMGAALIWFWMSAGFFSEGLRWLDGVLGASTTQDETRVRALQGAAMLAGSLGDAAVGRARLAEALELARKLGDAEGEAMSLSYLGAVENALGQRAAARIQLEAALPLARRLDYPWGLAHTLFHLGISAAFGGDVEAARASLLESAQIAESRGINWPAPHGVLSHMALQGEDCAAARRHLQATVRGTRESLAARERWTLTYWLEGCAGLAAVCGDPGLALRLGGAAAVLRDAQNTPLPGFMQALLDRRLDGARQKLGVEASAAAWEEGRCTSLEEAVGAALADLEAG